MIPSKVHGICVNIWLQGMSVNPRKEKTYIKNYIPRAIPTNRSSFTEEAIEVGATKRQGLGGSWRYIAGGLCRGREAEEEQEEGEERTGQDLEI